MKMLLLAASLLAWVAASGPGQVPADQPRPFTMRSALARAGFEIPAQFPPADLDRPWDSSLHAHDDRQFVAAIYFQDEMPREHILGPLHLIRVMKSGAMNRLRLDEKSGVERGGSIMGVSFRPPYSFVWTHFNPSAGYTLVLDDQFTLVGSLFGFTEPSVLGDGTILFHRSLIHFAPVHQAALDHFSPSTKQTTEVFPGSFESKYGALVMKGVDATIARIAAARGVGADRREFEIVDFDRSLGGVHIASDQREIAFTVDYFSDRMSYQDPNRERVGDRVVRKDPSWPVYSFSAIARCQRGATSWTCREEDLVEVAQRYQLALPAAQADIDRLIERLLSK